MLVHLPYLRNRKMFACGEKEDTCRSSLICVIGKRSYGEKKITHWNSLFNFVIGNYRYLEKRG